MQSTPFERIKRKIKMDIIRVTVLFLTSCIVLNCTSGTKEPMDQTDWIKNLPKVQFHLHLDGSVRLNTIWEIAQKDSIDLGVNSIEELAGICQVVKPMDDLQEVLDVFWVHQKVLNSYENIKRIAFENVEDAYNDGVVLQELRFAPTFISEGKEGLSNADIIRGVLDGVMAGMESYPVESRPNRHRSPGCRYGSQYAGIARCD